MMSTLIQIVTDALNEIGTWETPVTLIGNNNATAKRSIAIMQTAAETIAREYPWQALQAEHTFTTVADQDEYDPPADMRADWARLPGAQWDRANNWPLYGPLTPRQWQHFKSGIVQTAVRRWGRVKGGKFVIYPVPDVDGDTLVYEYMSKNWALSNAVPVDRWAADSDTFVLDDYLLKLEFKWRFLASDKLPHASEREDADRALEAAKGADGGKQKVNLARAPMDSTVIVGWSNIPETGFGS